MRCFSQFWGKARDYVLELYSAVQCRNHSCNTKYNKYSCSWSALKLCSEIPEGWSYLYFLSTLNLEMCSVITSTGLCFCAMKFIRSPWGLLGEIFWVFYCPWHFRTFINWCRMKGDALQCLSFYWFERVSFLLSPGQDFLGIFSYCVWRGHFLFLYKKK